MIYVACMGFNNPKVICDTFFRFNELTDTDGLEIKKIFYDCHYPLPDKEKNKEAYIAACDVWEWEYRSLPRNAGQDRNAIAIFKDLALQDSDLVLFFDPDNYPSDKNYLKAQVQHMIAHPETGYCTLWRHHPEFNMKEIQGLLQNEVPRFRHLAPSGGWPMGIFSGRFAKNAEAFQPTHSYYGGWEFVILRALRTCGMVGTMLEDYEDKMICVDHDQFYIAYKHIVINHTEHPSFEEWLNSFKMLEVAARGTEQHEQFKKSESQGIPSSPDASKDRDT